MSSAPPLPPGRPTEKEVRSALAKLVARGVGAVWLPDVQALLRLPAVQRKIVELGEDHAAEALGAVLRAAVEELGQSQYRSLLNIVLGLEPEYERLSAGEKRRIAGERFRGGSRQVSAGTIRQHHEPRALDQLASLLVSPVSQRRRGSEAPTPLTLWHPSIHQQWAGEQLVFWRMSFSNYRRQEAQRGLSIAMEASHVSSWSMHELYGLFDALVMAWVPRAKTTMQALHSLLLDALGSSLELLELFTVEHILMDSTWSSEFGSLISLPEQVLAEPLSAEEIEQVSGDVSDPDSKQYEVRGLIRRKAPASSGIGFFVMVSLQGHTLVLPQARQAFELRLSEVVRDAPMLSDLSIYRGSGFATFLIGGTLGSVDLSDLNDVLLEPLREVDPSGSMRINTFLASSPAPVAGVERLSGREKSVEPQSAEDLLHQEEGARFEVKGSAFTDLSRWFNQRDPEYLPRAGTGAMNSLCAAITALLNSEGGTIVIGALEENDRLARHKGHWLLESAPQVGRHLITGIDFEMPGGPDEFRQRLLTFCRARIKPEWASNTQLRFDQIGDRTVCIIDVRPPAQRGPRTWFYFGRDGGDLRFYVREGARSVVLTGPAADQYKAAHTSG